MADRRKTTTYIVKDVVKKLPPPPVSKITVKADMEFWAKWVKANPKDASRIVKEWVKKQDEEVEE